MLGSTPCKKKVLESYTHTYIVKGFGVSIYLQFEFLLISRTCYASCCCERGLVLVLVRSPVVEHAR
jgi:hypothetical protein